MKSKIIGISEDMPTDPEEMRKYLARLEWEKEMASQNIILQSWATALDEELPPPGTTIILTGKKSQP